MFLQVAVCARILTNAHVYTEAAQSTAASANRFEKPCLQIYL
jgi:hypothetical protein